MYLISLISIQKFKILTTHSPVWSSARATPTTRSCWQNCPRSMLHDIAWHTESYWPCWVLLALAWPFGAIWCDGNAKDSETHRHPSFFPKHPGLGKCWKFAPELQFRRSRRSPQKNTHRWSHRHVQIWAVPVSSAQTSSTAWSRVVSCSAPPCETLGKEWDAVMICATFLVYDQRTCLTHGLAWVCCEAISNSELVDKQ